MQISKNKLLGIFLVFIMITTTILAFNALKGLPDALETSDIWIDE